MKGDHVIVSISEDSVNVLEEHSTARELVVEAVKKENKMYNRIESLTDSGGKCTQTVLYCIVLYCIVLYCIALYCIVLYCILLFSLTVLTSFPHFLSFPVILTLKFWVARP